MEQRRTKNLELKSCNPWFTRVSWPKRSMSMSRREGGAPPKTEVHAVRGDQPARAKFLVSRP